MNYFFNLSKTFAVTQSRPWRRGSGRTHVESKISFSFFIRTYICNRDDHHGVLLLRQSHPGDQRGQRLLQVTVTSSPHGGNTQRQRNCGHTGTESPFRTTEKTQFSLSVCAYFYVWVSCMVTGRVFGTITEVIQMAFHFYHVFYFLPEEIPRCSGPSGNALNRRQEVLMVVGFGAAKMKTNPWPVIIVFTQLGTKRHTPADSLRFLRRCWNPK